MKGESGDLNVPDEKNCQLMAQYSINDFTFVMGNLLVS